MKQKNIKIESTLHLTEGVNTDNPKKVIISGLLFPKNKISRNKVVYDWESMKKILPTIIRKPIMYNHSFDGQETPVGHCTDIIALENRPTEGKWQKYWDNVTKELGYEQPGVYYEADLNPDSQYTKSVLRGDIKHVSFNILSNNYKELEDEQNGHYTYAYIDELLEFSVVPVPGFKQTTIDIAYAEKMENEIFTKLVGRYKKKLREDIKAEFLLQYIESLDENEAKNIFDEIKSKIDNK